ncbi:DUF2911 domain-containing protein [Marinoscillum furvescens]|uniref:DUF2911 family protein n=1 Tax=Marinoscillum furvescens DSM 4134 TaxID=1122208 RepID=A0A3D9L482_MARFU|nr:DUF2911 domain-containing protein [Marinoscillum furvescens]RED99747.1 hypothetical protein C7460_10729 [Marinoscillum furvescens DSM 4134]
MNQKHNKLVAMIALICLVAFQGIAQDKSNRPSPPAETNATVGDVDVTINYSQPAVKGRKIWDGLVPYGKVWRTGANEASWIEVSDDVTINGESLSTGKYGFFTIPGENEWTLIFNEKWKQWGAYDYDESQDFLRVTAKPEKSDKFYERFTIEVNEDGSASLNWADLSVPFTIKAE